MPELPEVETVRRGLVAAMEGKRIAGVTLRRPDLRFPIPADFAARLTGRRIVRIDRRAKYLLAHTDGGDVALMHLGMSGRFTIVPPGGFAAEPGRFYHNGATGAGEGPHDHVVLALEDGTRIVYTDPRRFGVMDLVAEAGLAGHRLLRDLGVEPLGNAFNAPYLAEAFAGRRTPVKAALLDQRKVVGLGNIYVCEALFRARISPRRLAASLAPKGVPTARLERLVAAARAVLQDAIAAGGSSLRDYARADGELGYFQHTFDVYDRAGEPCRREGCTGTVSSIVQSNRSTFYCGRCQR